MIQETKAFVANCDNCNEPFEDRFSGFGMYADYSALTEAMSNSEWHITEGKGGEEHEEKCYCRKCYQFDEEENLVIKTLS
jgi:hypothetical protein